jgi:hypothetical protein
MRRLGELREAAVEYLERHLGFQIPDEVAHGVPPRDLLLIASQKGPAAHPTRASCSRSCTSCTTSRGASF